MSSSTIDLAIDSWPIGHRQLEQLPAPSTHSFMLTRAAGSSATGEQQLPAPSTPGRSLAASWRAARVDRCKMTNAVGRPTADRPAVDTEGIVARRRGRCRGAEHKYLRPNNGARAVVLLAALKFITGAVAAGVANRDDSAAASSVGAARFETESPPPDRLERPFAC
uniref:Uncharacterized protein n=1 Tax=Plectus sambesii TaxID=2011161 RepID=A0A914WV53_9BILA